MTAETASNRREKGIAVLLFLLAALLPPGCGGRESGGGASSGGAVQKYQGRTMGTMYHVALVAPDHGEPELSSLQEVIRNALDDVVRMASIYDPESEISRFNAHASPSPFTVSRELAHMVEAALHAARETGGAYDPTVLPLVRLFGFGREERSVPPAPEAIEAVLASVGYQGVRMDPEGRLIKSHPETELDLGGIAKGYAVDRVAEKLNAAGCRNWMVEVGGEVRASGCKPGGAPWRVGIETPLEGAPFGDRIHRSISLENRAVATSGDYRNFKEREGVRWHHIIDPRTGENPANDLASVTVLSASCTRADALATALMVLGLHEGTALIERLPGVEALFIRPLPDGGFATSMTSGFPK
jgi:thiamine biosynthesis lipoprotein